MQNKIGNQNAKPFLPLPPTSPNAIYLWRSWRKQEQGYRVPSPFLLQTSQAPQDWSVKAASLSLDEFWSTVRSNVLHFNYPVEMVLWLEITGGLFITPETENMMEPAWSSIKSGERCSPRELI